MSEKLNIAGDAGVGAAPASLPDDEIPLDEHTTEPNAPSRPPQASQPPDGKWQMPKPKFQQSSGYLPQGYLKDVQQATESDASSQGPENPDLDQEPVAARAAEPPAIEPQPELADQFIQDEPVTEAQKPSQKAGSGPTALMFVLGILGMMIFVALFIAAVWYFYFSGRSIGPFN